MSWAELSKERLQPTHKAVIFAILDSERRLLVEDRTKPGGSFTGYTIIPGGSIESGESPQEALRREMSEELGVTPLKTIPLPHFLDVTLSKHFVEYHPFLVIEYAGEVQNKEPEKSNHRWVTLDEADNLPFASTQLIIQRIRSTLTSTK